LKSTPHRFWRLSLRLTETRAGAYENRDLRRSVLPLVLARQIREGWLGREDPAGLSDGRRGYGPEGYGDSGFDAENEAGSMNRRVVAGGPIPGGLRSVGRHPAVGSIGLSRCSPLLAYLECAARRFRAGREGCRDE